MRSLLFAPADSQRKVDKALTSAADVVILDLEDSVSLENKTIAREIAATALGQPRQNDQLVYVRVNPLDSGLTDDDVRQLLPAKPDGIMQPKTSSADDVDRLRQLLGCNIPIIAIATETAASLFNLGTYAALNPPLAGLTWGAEDLSNALGAATSRDMDGNLTGPYQLARTLCLVGARAAATEPFDTVCVNFSDPDALELECMNAACDGFTGKNGHSPKSDRYHKSRIHAFRKRTGTSNSRNSGICRCRQSRSARN